MSSAVPVQYRFVHIILMTFGIIHATSTSENGMRSAPLAREKRQSGTFSQVYSFRPTSCRPGTIAGTAPATGATFYGVADANFNIGVNSGNGQVFLANYLTANQPYTVRVNAYTSCNTASFRAGTCTVSGTTTVTVTCLTASGTPPSGGVVTNSAPVPSQSSYVFTSTNCNAGVSVGTVSVTNPTSVLFGAFTSGTPFLVSSTGTITLSRAFTGSQSITVTATNPYGTTQIPVTITCTGSTGGTGVTFPIFTSSLYTMASTCTAGATVGQVAVSNPAGTTYSLASSAPGVSVNPTTGQVTLASTVTGTVNFAVIASNSAGSSATTVSLVCAGSSGTGTVVSNPIRFTVPVYTFYPTGTACAAGGTIGSVGVIGALGPVTYAITSTNPGYAISPAGVITAPATGPVAGTYQVTATSAANGAQSTTARFTISMLFCSSTTTTTTCPAFAQTSYSFTPPQPAGCGFFTNIGIVGATCPTGRVTYAIPFAAVNNFGIDPNSGQIYATVPSTTCQTLQVTATAQDGTARTATTTVAIACNGGTCTATGGTASTGCGTPGQPSCGDIG